MIRFDNLPPEVMQAMCTPMHLILPSSTASSPATHVKHTGSLYLGSFSAILDPSLLSSHKISALVQVLDAPWLPNLDGNPQYAKVECYQLGILDSSSDETREDLKARLEETVLWIDDRLRRGVNVLVHCQQGVSRSAAIVIAYLMYAQNMTYDSAFELVKRKRACVKPNSGFVRCLQEWEKQSRYNHHLHGGHGDTRPSMRRAKTAPGMMR